MAEGPMDPAASISKVIDRLVDCRFVLRLLHEAERGQSPAMLPPMTVMSSEFRLEGIWPSLLSVYEGSISEVCFRLCSCSL